MPKFGSSVKNFLARCQSCMLIRRMPLVLRGLAASKAWPDFRPARPEGPIEANPLREYFQGVNTGPGIWKIHHYLDIYHRHFRKFVGKEVYVAEVGVYSGGSLQMWKHYFGPRCTVYGVDIQAACKAYEAPGVRIFIGDQGDRGFWRDFRRQVPVLDILIDDGGHEPEQQIVTLQETLPYLRGGGIYICEDITGAHNRFLSYLAGFSSHLYDFNLRGGTEGRETIMEASPFQRSISSIHLYPFVTVIEIADQAVENFVGSKRGTQWQPFQLGRME